MCLADLCPSDSQVLARLLIEHPDGWEFDWMDALETCGRDDRDDHVLHRSLYSFALQTPSPLLQALLISPPPAAACPGGRLTCLRIVSFWLSWLRLLYCPTKPQGFRMSKIYMDEVEPRAVDSERSILFPLCKLISTVLHTALLLLYRRSSRSSSTATMHRSANWRSACLTTLGAFLLLMTAPK